MASNVTYKTHILIGVRADGLMAVLADWPHVPRQAEVLDEIRQAGEAFAAFALCTPTSILPAANGENSSRPVWHER
jgi:hypothetical protein